MIASTNLRRLIFATAISAIAFVHCACSYDRYGPPAAAFSGNSDACKQTVIVPTLDSPAPKGKNVIWCGTIQLAYGEFKKLAGRPEDDPQSKETLARLDAARMNRADLPDKSYYIAAGWAKDGIVQKIRSDMARQFPQFSPNLPEQPGLVAMSYAYLAADVKFRTAYCTREGGDKFTDSAGNKTAVTSFGSFKQPDADINETLARQIGILYAGGVRHQPSEFVLDLDRNSRPSQLILACVEPKDTLAATWQDVRRKMQGWTPKDDENRFSQRDSLVVPDVVFKIDHEFKELQGRGDLVKQMIDFRLDKSGAVLTSESMWEALGMGRSFNFTRPFLVVMRKRGSAEPYFVMWIDNAELLCKPAGK